MKHLVEKLAKEKRPLKLKALTIADFVLALLVFVASLMLYVRTLAPSLVYSDGAEFQTLAYTLGMTHPTGYPIYLLIGKLFTYIPLGNIAYRVNLMSAVLGALSLSILYLIAKILSGHRVAAILAPFWLGINGIFWSQAIMAEVYTTATLFSVSILLLMLLWRQSNRWIYLFAAGLLGSLGIGTHSSVLLMAPAILIYLLLSTRQWKDWLGALMGVLLGSAVALTAFILLSRIQIPASYYAVGLRFAAPNLILSQPTLGQELNRAFFMLFARSFQGDVFATSDAVMLESMSRYWEYLTDWLPMPGLILMGLGLIALFIAHWREGILFTISLLVALLFMFTNNSYGLYVFCIPSYALLSLLLSLSAVALMDGLIFSTNIFLPQSISRKEEFKSSSQKTLWALWQGSFFTYEWAAQFVPVVLMSIVLLWSLPAVLKSWQAGHIAFIDNPGRESRYFLQKTIYIVDKPDLPYHEADIGLKSIAPKAILFSEWNELYTYFYVANVEQNRTDLEIYEVCKFAQPGNESENQAILAYIGKNSKQRPIYFTKQAANTCTALIDALNTHYRFQKMAGGRLWKLMSQDLK